MAASPPWANLIGALVREIATRLPCKFDRVHFAAVCRSWRESLEQLAPLPRSPALPFLILPLAEGPAVSCILSDYATHPAVVPDWVRYARYIGAYDDGWVFLSTAPPQDVDGRCVFAGIINVGPVPQGRPMIAFWRIFDPVVPGLFSGPLNPRREWDAVDVVHHHGAFHFLTQGEHIIVAKPEFHYWCPVPAMPQVDWEFRCFPSNRRGYNQQHVKARYLVKSREDLLMVVRCSPHPGQPTSAFKVFRMVPSQRARCRQYIWQRVPSLGGRMLFAPARRLAAPQPATTSATAAARLSRYCAGAESPRQTLRASARAVVGEIANHLPCEFDRVHFAAVCRSWRASLEQQAPVPLPPALPVLILPLAERPAVSFVLSNCAIHPAVLPEWPHDARYIGAYDDGWSSSPLLHLEVLESTASSTPKTPALTSTSPPTPGQEWQLPFSIVAATLSSQPDVDGCVFAGIISVDPVPRGQRTIGFWRASDRVIPHLFQTHNPPWDVEDVVFYDGAFHFLTQGEHIIVAGPDFHGGDPVDWEMRAFEHIGREYDQYVEARYLVESREDLLMVVRCSPYPGQPTSEFRVFRMAQAGPDDVFPYQHYVWLELPSLEGRMLFVGRGCSRSYDADQYPGFEGGVYFFDDDIQDPAMLPLGVATLFSFNDCEKWTRTPASMVERCFPAIGYTPQDESAASANKQKGCSIPDLPEDIWRHIHSLMPMRDAARTACLSHSFLCIGVKTLKLELSGTAYHNLDNWLQVAVTPGIEELTLMRFSCLRVHGCVRLKLIESKVPNLSTLDLSGKAELLLGETLQMKNLSMRHPNVVCYARSELPSSMPNIDTLALSSYDEVTNDPMKHESILGHSSKSHLRQMAEDHHCHLKNVEITGFSSAKSLVELTCYILKNSVSLECLTLDTLYPYDFRCSDERFERCRTMRIIANRLPCVYNRVHLAGVCRPWRESLERLPPLLPPPKLPYLILPLAEQPAFSCVLSGGATHPFFVPERIRHACYFGSYDGGWAFLSTLHPQANRVYFLANLAGTSGTFNLPNRIQLEREALELAPEEKPLLHRLVIYTATLSSDPFMDGCVVAGLINDQAPIPGYRRQKIAFWQIEDRVVVGYFYMGEACWDAVDVVRHNGAFHFLTKGEDIIVGNPVFAEAGAPPQVQWEYRCFSSQGRGYDGQHVVARYLVESSGELLMVVRCSPRPGEFTSAFKVFRMAQPEEDDDAPSLDGRTMLFVGRPCSRSDGDVVRYIWRELPSLEGRMLFVGRGCSRSYDADQYPGFEGGIYFFDHRIAGQLGDAPAQYPCSDCGKWTGKPALQVDRFFPEQDPSNYTSQVWLLNGSVRAFLEKPLNETLLKENVATSRAPLLHRASQLRLGVRRVALENFQELLDIANRLPCVYNRVHLAGVCRPWREHLERLPPLLPPPKLPYLILPLAEQLAFSCVLSDCATHPFFVPEWIRHACYFGSYDGGWAFVSTAHPRAQGYRDYFLTNLHQTPNTFVLPVWIQLDREEPVLRPRQKRLRPRDPLFINAATLSSDPFMDGCVVAGFVNNCAPVPGHHRQKIAFWRIDDKVVIGCFFMEDACWDAVDVVRHNGAFHFLTNGQHIVVGNPGFDDEANAPPQVQWEYRCFSSQGRGYDGQHVVARYLVESSGELLMVVRCSPRPGESTSAFKVFRMAQPEEDDDGDGDAPLLDGRTMLFVGDPCSRSDGDVVRYIWRELPSLEGRMLFVGRGCSRSYNTDQYPGFEGGVYFFDHRIPGQGGGAPALYPCRDCGKWTGKPALQVELCFPEQDPSNYSSQVWLLNGSVRASLVLLKSY
uniref:DUF295 domain-containing protein n=1 Tax=Oryza rufipogon TaxID=4529 RepID=A0A0E0N363_ORYRU